jgi:hypothetical protein
MKRLIAMLAGLLTLCANAPSGMAGQPSVGEPPSSEAVKPAAAHPQVMKPRALTGQVVGVDQGAKTVTVKGTGQAPKQMTFTLDKASTVFLSRRDKVEQHLATMDGGVPQAGDAVLAGEGHGRDPGNRIDAIDGRHVGPGPLLLDAKRAWYRGPGTTRRARREPPRLGFDPSRSSLEGSPAR